LASGFIKCIAEFGGDDDLRTPTCQCPADNAFTMTCTVNIGGV
jgi:hypothetical protein